MTKTHDSIDRMMLALLGSGLVAGTLVFAPVAVAYPPPCVQMDRDADCLTNVEEGPGGKWGTSPNNPDSDGDQLEDGEEVDVYRTDPMKKDTDGDGLEDWYEPVNSKTDPTRADTDGDGKNDGFEFSLKGFMDPLSQDPEKTGPPSAQQAEQPAPAPAPEDNGGERQGPPGQDSDGDGLPDKDELIHSHTNPLLSDTDFDDVNDFDEMMNKTNPLNPFDN